MKIRTSYFYQVRHFRDYMLPLSTAMYDPKWFHDNKGNSYQFRDKNGIINGGRAIMFTPDKNCDGLCHGPETCDGKPDNCKFLKNYKKQLDNLNFKKVMKWLEDCAEFCAKWSTYKGEEPIIVLLFHEKPDNPCSERWAVIDWFKEHGVDVDELEYPIKDNYD